MYFDAKSQKDELKHKIWLLLIIILSLLTIGTVVYHFTEKWSVIDSLYFSAISLATRGYSNLHPTTWFSVIFSIFYLFIGVAIIIYAISTLITYYTTFYEKKVSEMLKNMRKPKEPDRWIVIKQKKR